MDALRGLAKDLGYLSRNAGLLGYVEYGLHPLIILILADNESHNKIDNSALVF